MDNLYEPDPRFIYAELRFALEWLETCKERIDTNTSYAMEESINIALGYLKYYCKTIKLEEK